ncbi:MYND-type domain-containing protein [Mycena sanguinolenta]|uniref:MYND-type domain-containing protein n=1 Tax=Mycena sanguinolenta TaxID=230812 RepID=A0A8H6Z7X5_9AGAR|nr:MYND-type domain-containing protein [Mycena sanguinolenta]
MLESLRAGLLPLIVRTASMPKENTEGVDALQTLLDHILPGSTVSYTVVAELKVQLPAVDSIIGPEFQNSRYASSWESFVSLARRRIDLMDEMDTKASVVFKACDNMDCDTMGPKTNFKRCSNCREAYYCSVDCQKIDWGSGGHRKRCHSIRTHSLKNDLDAKNRAFMRRLLRADLVERRYEEALSLHDPGCLFFLRDTMRRDPSDILVTVLDYSANGYPRLHIEGLAQLRADDERGAVYWEEHIARAARSRGRMELHLMLVRDGPGSDRVHRRKRWLMFPQRSEHPSFHHALLQIFRHREETDETETVAQLMNSAVKLH